MDLSDSSGLWTDLPRGELTQVTQQQQGTTRPVTPKRVDFTYNLAGERAKVTRTGNTDSMKEGGPPGYRQSAAYPRGIAQISLFQ